MQQNKLPETLPEWALMTDEMSNMTTWDALLRDSSADSRRSTAQGMNVIAVSIVLIERKKILDALSPHLKLHPFDRIRTPEGIDDRFVSVFSSHDWIDYCMSAATQETKDLLQSKLMNRYRDLLEDDAVFDPVDFLDAETADIVAETHVLAREVLFRLSIPFLRDLALGKTNGYSVHEIYRERSNSPTLLIQRRSDIKPMPSNVQILETI